MDGYKRVENILVVVVYVLVFILYCCYYICRPRPASSSPVHGQSNSPSASISRGGPGGRSTTSYTSASSSQFQDEAQVVSLEPNYELVAVVIDVDKVAEIAESCAECVICFESLSSDLEQGGGDRGSGVKILGECGHKYHAVCIDQWLSKHRDCPLCRRHIPRRSR